MKESAAKEKTEGFLHPLTDPLFAVERERRRKGIVVIGGVDEAGRGALIGPVVAAAAVFPSDAETVPYVFDSKQITEEGRERIRERLLAMPGFRYAIGEVSAAEIDQINILHAAMEAMRRAAIQLLPGVDLFLIDGNRKPPGIPVPLQTIVKGDAKSASIAAASLLAKTHRDALLRDYAIRYPQYGFERHKGYATADHLDAIRAHGVLPEHRRTFAPVRDILSPFSQGELF